MNGLEYYDWRIVVRFMYERVFKKHICHIPTL